MAKQKRLNKNLVAFLTVMGMLLVVSLVGLVVWQQANRDPKVYAEMAAEALQSGDLTDAARRYNSAWRASQDLGNPEPEYLLKAADCVLEMGEIIQWRGLLQQGASQYPTEPQFRRALLLGFWRLRDIRGGQMIWENDWRDMGRELAKLEPDGTLGPVCAAYGLWAIGGPAERQEADDLAQEVYSRAPQDPYAALAYHNYLTGKSRDEFNTAQARNAPLQELEKLAAEWRVKARQVLEPALLANPEHSALCNTFASLLLRQANELAREDPAAANAQRTEALRAISTALEHAAADARPELYVNRAQTRLAIMEAERLPLDGERAKALAPQVAEIDADLQQALNLDKAIYEAYRLRGELARVYTVPTDAEREAFRAAPDPAAAELQWRVGKAVDIYESARAATQTLRTLRAQLSEGQRLLFLLRGFQLALAFHSLVTNEPLLKEAPRAELFLADAQTKASDSPITAYMEGQLFAARGDFDAATTRFELAQQRSQVDPRQGEAAFWGGVGAPATPAERLATLQMQRQQYGEAERWSKLAEESYTRYGGKPPLDLLAVRGEVLVRLDRAQEALDFLNRYRADHPDNRQLEAIRAAALTRLGRPEEAQQAIALVQASGSPDDIRGEMWRAERAIEMEDYATAEEVYRGVVANEKASDRQVSDALQRLVLICEKTRGRAEARELLAGWLAQPPRAVLKRLLEAIDLELAVEDPTQLTPKAREELDARRLEILKSASDPAARAQGLYQFYAAREEWGPALEQLAELRKALPDDLRILEEEFRVYLRQKEFARATALLPQLAQANEGRGFDLAGGAQYRGDLATAQGQLDVAIREYRQAIAQAPKSAELQNSLASAYILAERFSEAVEALNRAVEYNPRNFQSWYLLRVARRTLADKSYGAEKAAHENAARQAEARAMELNPNFPEVREWAEIAAEEQDPAAAITKREQRRQADPTDDRNALRLAALYVRAWDQAAQAQDQARQEQLAAQAEPFFVETLKTLTGPAQLRFMPAAATWFAMVKNGAAGEALLREVTQSLAGFERLQAQLNVAGFLEMVESFDAAEREYQSAQQFVRELTSQEPNPTVVMKVGSALIGFHKRGFRWEKVAEACRWLLDRLGNSATAEALPVRIELIETLVRAEKYAEAERELAALSRLYPDNPIGLQLNAQLLATRGRREEAIAEFGRVLQKEPDNLIARFGRGKLLLQRGQYDKAAEDLEEALKLIEAAPQFEGEIREALAALYGQWRKFDLAAGELRRLLDLQEQRDAPDERKQATVRRLARVMYVGLNQFDQAQKLISEYMERHPDESLWAYELGRLFENRAVAARDDASRAAERGDTNRQRERAEAARQDFASAASYYQRATERAAAEDRPQERTISLISQLSALNAAGRTSEVKQICTRIPLDGLDERQAAETRARVGAEFALAHGSTPEAARLWRQTLLEAASVHVSIVGELAQQRLPEVVSREVILGLLRDAAQAAPPASPAALRLQLILAGQMGRAGQFDAALAALDGVLQQVSAGSPEQMSGLLTKAQALELTGNAPAAVEAYKKIIEGYQHGMPPAGPDFLRTALNNLAYTLVTADPPVFAPAEARTYIERLQSLMGPNDATATMLDTIGWVYFKNGELAQAAAALEEAISLGGPSATTALHLAEVYLAQKRDSDAREILNRALQAARDRQRADEIQALESRLAELK